MTWTPPPEPESAVERLLIEARRNLDRVEPEDLADEVAAGAWVIDTRPEANRVEEGELPGAILVERIHLEWRLDPSSPWKLEGVEPDTRAIIVCNEGYSSSLAAATLRQLGLARATDLIGGYRAWRATQSPA
jgi:rhodanese-related sulfurtransferase